MTDADGAGAVSRPPSDAALRPSSGDETVYVALGSNLGDRAAHLAAARVAVAALPDTRVLDASRVLETAPLGAPDQPPYLNQMLALRTLLAPLALLDRLLDVEQAAGRVRAERWGPRTLDCDVVRFGTRVIVHPRLTVPHPELPNRAFWSHALRELQASPAVREAA